MAATKLFDLIGRVAVVTGLWEHEIFYVLEGKVEFHCEDQVETVGAGETVFLPKGKAHAYYMGRTGSAAFRRARRKSHLDARRLVIPRPTWSRPPRRKGRLLARPRTQLRWTSFFASSRCQAKRSASTARSQRFDGAANTEEYMNEKDSKCS
jgi:hypothetical protein